MKHNWTYKKLGELVDVLNGYAFKSSNYVKDGIRVIRIANVQKGKIVDEAPAFYPLSAESELTRYMLHEDDILLSLTGNVGRVGLLPKEMLPAALNQRVACLRIKDDTLMFKFLYQFLNSDYFEQKCIESSRGIAQLNMSTEWLKDYPLPIPSLDEQQAIVRELDGINRLIDLQEEQLREYNRLAQSLFYTTFGDPATNPKGWEVKKLGDVADVRDGTHDSPKYLLQSDYVLITSKNIVDGRIDFSASVNYISEADYEAINRRSKVDVGDIIMPMIGTIGNPIIVEETSQKYGIKNVALVKMGNAKELVNIYLKMLLDSTSYAQYIKSLNRGGTQKFIALGTIRGFDIPLPPLALQQTFAAQIEAIEQQKALIRRSLDDTRTLLAARMQYYFNS